MAQSGNRGGKQREERILEEKEGKVSQKRYEEIDTWHLSNPGNQPRGTTWVKINDLFLVMAQSKQSLAIWPSISKYNLGLNLISGTTSL